MLKTLKYKIGAILLAAMLSCTGLGAQEISVKASMDSVAMIIGHQTKLTLELTKPQNADVAFPLVLDTLVDKVEVLSRTKIDTTLVGDSREHLTQEFTIASFDSGFYYIPPFEFEIQASSGGGTLFTNPLALKIYTYQIDTIQGIFDIKSVQKIPVTFKEVWPYLLGFIILALMVLVGFLVYWKMKKKGPVFAPKPEPKEPPYIVAFRELERIRSEKLWQQDKIKEYYTDLTDTIRTYIEGRFQVLAMEQTSEEILKDIKGLIDKEEYKRLEATLKLADLVKFAKMTPLMDESERCIKDAYAFVDHTKPLPMEDEDESEDEEESSSEVESKN